MSIKSHAKLLEVVSVIWIVGMILGVIIFGIMGRVGTAVAVMFAGVPGLMLMWEILLSLVPIECDQPGCHGRVGHRWANQAPFRWNVRYVCRDFGHETDAPVNFSFGGGDSWN